MNCPECGYPKENHRNGALGMGCYFVGDDGHTYAHETCTMSPEKIELAAWKAEAMAARRVLDSAEWNDADFVAYMAARVKDE